MLSNLLKWIRQKYHPLFHLRQSCLYPILAKALDHSIFIRIPGVSFPVAIKMLRDFSWISNFENLEPEIKKIFKKIFTIYKPKVFFDIGANIGFYSWFSHSLDKDIKCYCFEPDPINFKLLKKTIKRNRLKNISVINSAISNENASVDFFQDKVSGATGNLASVSSVSNPYSIQNAYGLSEKISVNTLKLDDFIASQDVFPELVKIDAEGAEKLIVEGAVKLIKKANTIFIIECSSLNKEFIFEKFNKMKYVKINLSDASKTDSKSPNNAFIPHRLFGKISDLI